MFFKFLILFIFLFFSISCTQINSTSQQHYSGSSGFRHGLVPDTGNLSVPDIEVKLENLPKESLASGQALYEAHCLACHGKSGKGNGPKAGELDRKPKELANLAKTVPQFKFYMMVSRQVGQMPGWKTIFTDQEITDLENYLKTL